MMTKKHFIEAAKVVTAMRDVGPTAPVISATAFVKLFESDNPRFDRARFFDACNLTAKERKVLEGK
jgi:hypothetical protein